MRRFSALALALTGTVMGATTASAETVEQLALAGPTLAVESSTIAASATASSASMSIDDPSSSENGASDWNVAFTPYLWVAGTSGDIAIPRGSGEVEIDKSFADVLGNLNFAFMGALDIEHDRFVAVGDLMYLSVGAKAEGIQDPGFFEGKVDASVLVATALAGYRIVDQGQMFVDLLAGGRVVSLDVDLELEGPLQTREAGASPSDISPLIGARARFPLGEKWGIAFYTDVGNIFGDSDVKWQVVGTVQRDLGKHWRVAAGYRHIAINHDAGDMKLDLSLSGPIIGFTYKF